MTNQPPGVWTTTRRRGRPRKHLGEPELSPARLVEVAIRAVERKGFAGLNMRGVAAELDVSATAIYNHFAHKTALLDAVIDRIMADVRPPPTHADWVEELIAHALNILECERRYPGFMDYTLSRGPQLDSEQQRRVAGITLSLFARGGFFGEAAVRAYAVCYAYLVGWSQLHAPIHDAASGPPRPADWLSGPDRLPAFDSLALDYTAIDGASWFVHGLRVLLRGLAADAVASPRTEVS